MRSASSAPLGHVSGERRGGEVARQLRVRGTHAKGREGERAGERREMRSVVTLARERHRERVGADRSRTREREERTRVDSSAREDREVGSPGRGPIERRGDAFAQPVHELAGRGHPRDPRQRQRLEQNAIATDTRPHAGRHLRDLAVQRGRATAGSGLQQAFGRELRRIERERQSQRT